MLLAALVAPAAASAAITQPAQQISGPGGSNTPYKNVKITAGGVNGSSNAWYVFEPVTDKPTTLPLVVVTHGYGEFSGNRQNGALAWHTALEGNVVIYPRWQNGLSSPCPGPFFIQPCINSEVAGIKGALAFLKANPDHNQADTAKTSYFGFSFGGIITADIANRWLTLGLPEPRDLWLDDPHDGGYTWEKEYALDDSLAGIPATTKVVCHSGSQGVTTKSLHYSCGALYPRLPQIPAANKSLVMTFPDTHGTPALTSAHGVCAGPAPGDTSPAPFSGDFAVDAYDYGFCWRSFDALRSCALTATDCQYALGDTPENRYTGTWSDGTPFVGLKVMPGNALLTTPTSPRQPAPATS